MREERDSVPVWISDSDFASCYDEFCHQVLWPALHYAVPDAPKTKAFYESASYKQYVAVNQRFADAIVSAYAEGDIIWVNDYHLMLLPTMLRERLPKINFLVLSPGLLNFRGRDETAEGIDKRLGLHYYSRWKFVQDLLPLVRKAKEAGEDAKIMSILAAGHGGAVNLDDLAMRKSYSLARAGMTSPTYTDLMFEVRPYSCVHCLPMPKHYPHPASR